MKNITQDQLFYIVPTRIETHFIDFATYRIEGWAEGKDWNEKKIYSYELADNCEVAVPLFLKNEAMSNANENLTLDYKEAEVFVKASIKWDGCSHINFPSYAHFCSGYDSAGVGRLMEELYQIAKEKMEELGTEVL